MPFPIDIKYILDTEIEMKVQFPKIFVQKMLKENGGDVFALGESWNLYPFFDKTDKKRISRTCNHIGLETNKIKEWVTFPNSAVTIGNNACGDQLILLPNLVDENTLQDAIFIWEHETGSIRKIADNILELVDIE